MAKTRKNSTRRRKYSREKYSKKKKYSKKNKYSKKKYRKSNRKQRNNRRNMKGGLVTLKDFENDEEILVLREDDEAPEEDREDAEIEDADRELLGDPSTHERSLVIRDDDMAGGIEPGWLAAGDFEAQQMKGWIMEALNKDGYFPRIENPDDIQLYKGGKSIGDLFTGDEEEDAENDITIYVKLPSQSEATTSATTTVVDTSNKSSEQSKPKLPLLKTGRLSEAEERLEYLRSQAERYGEGFLGTGIIVCYVKRLCNLDELRSFYNLYIKDENINQKDGVGFTMINLAVKHNLYPIIEFLLNIPRIIINGNNMGDNPLLYSIYMIVYYLDEMNRYKLNFLYCPILDANHTLNNF